MQEILLSFPSWDWKKFDSKHFLKVSFELTEVYRESIFANLGYQSFLIYKKINILFIWQLIPRIM